MASGLAEGYAQRALLEAATPLALDEANRYGLTASENMSAINTDRLHDQQNQTSIATANIGASAQVAAASIAAEGQWRRAQLEAELTQRGWDRNSIEAALDRDWRAEQTQLDRDFTLGRDQQQRDWNVEDRDLNRQWGVEDRDFNRDMQRESNWWNYNANRENANNQVAASIFGNPNLTAEQQQAAWANYQRWYNDTVGRFNGSLANPPPGIFGPRP